MKQIHRSLKSTFFLIAALSITVAAYNDVLSKSSVNRSENQNESERVFDAFKETAFTGKNSSILMKAVLGGVRDHRQETENKTGVKRGMATNLEGPAPLNVSFDTRDVPQGVISYEWSFGDGDIASGASVSHTFEHQGTYMVTLRTLEKTGIMRLDQVKVNVSSALP